MLCLKNFFSSVIKSRIGDLIVRCRVSEKQGRDGR